MKIALRNKQLFVFFALFMLMLPTSSFAADLPAILVLYKNVVQGIITKVLVGIVIIVMMGYAAWESRTGQQGLQPLKWASLASIVLASAVYFGPSMINYANSAFSTAKINSIGSNGVVVSS